jgi:hypothetical protein
VQVEPRRAGERAGELGLAGRRRAVNREVDLRRALTRPAFEQPAQEVAILDVGECRERRRRGLARSDHQLDAPAASVGSWSIIRVSV